MVLSGKSPMKVAYTIMKWEKHVKSFASSLEGSLCIPTPKTREGMLKYSYDLLNDCIDEFGLIFQRISLNKRDLSKCYWEIRVLKLNRYYKRTHRTYTS